MVSSFLLTLIGGVAVTLTMRTLPLAVLSHLRFPAAVRQGLGFVPVAIMAALITSDLLTQPARTEAGWNLSALATGACVVAGLLTRSLFLTVLVGIAAFAVLGWVVP